MCKSCKMDSQLLIQGSVNTIHYRQKTRAGNAAITPELMIFANSLGGQGLVHSNDFSFADTRRLLQVLQWDSGNRHVFLVDRVGNVQERVPDNRMGILPAIQLAFPGITHLGRFISDNP